MSNIDIFSDKLLINLRILSKIPKNGKICRSSDGVISLEIQNAGLFSSLRRFLTSDSRKQTLLEINKILGDSFTKYKEIVQSEQFVNKKGETLNILREELDKATVGLENLKTTYQDDQTMVSHLDIYILKTKSIILDITNYISNKCTGKSLSNEYTSLNSETVIFMDDSNSKLNL